MVRIVAVIALLTALAALGAAKGGVEFTNERFFRFGMNQADAEAVLQDEKNWKIMYRVDTTQTSSIACVYQNQVFYQVDFYQGRCYRLEKRAELALEQIDPTFKHFLDRLGETSEMTSSRDEKLVFARWMAKDREISLTADSREPNVYMLTYEEQDPITKMDAEHEMEQELGNAPQEVDPITGKVRPGLPQPGAGGETDEAGQGEGGDTAGKDGAKKDEANKDEVKKDETKKDEANKGDGNKDDGGSGGGGDTGSDGHDID